MASIDKRGTGWRLRWRDLRGRGRSHQALSKAFMDEMKRLRDPSFQDLLENYPRPHRLFVRAYGVEDEVESVWLVRDGDGQQYKPEDYLEAFARFVREHKDEVDAIRILLDRPADWSPEALGELKRKLEGHPLRFTLDRLQRAHEVRYHRALVDVISMVKHAADEEAPLLTAAERVDRALQRIAAGRRFTDEQKAWLEHSRQHLQDNLSIDRDDFGLVPELEREGGWGAFRRAFGEDVTRLLHELNEGLAA